MSLLQIRLEAARKSKSIYAQSIEEPKSSLPVSIPEDMFDIAASVEQQLKTAEFNDLELVPRETVLKLLRLPLDTMYTFKTQLGRGAAYVQAMRQVLSRARGKALRGKIPLQEFKVYEMEIKSEADYDVVTLIRTRRLLEQEQSVYDELIAHFAKVPLTTKK